MRSYFAHGALLMVGLVLAGTAPRISTAQDLGSPRLLPIPTEIDFLSASPVAHQDAVVVEAAPSDNPAQLPSPSDAPLQAPPSYKTALQQWGSDSCTSACGENGCGGGGRGYWFGSFGVLILGSPTRNSTVLSYDASTFQPIMQTGDTTGVFAGGIDLTVGRMFGCGNWGAAFTYWGVYPAAQTADVFNAGSPISSALNFSGLDYNGAPGNTYWDNVSHQQLVTNQVINSLEWNLLGNCGCGGLFACSPWQGCNCGGGSGPRFGSGWMFGVRYFQFNDDFLFSSDNTDFVLNGAVNEMQYQIRTRNDMVGFQVGGGLHYRLWNCFSVYGIGKAGIYGNHSSVFQSISGAAGDATVNAGPFATTGYRFQSSQDNLAFLGQLDLGGRYQVNNCWSLNVGYRMVGISGLALTEGQIPNNFANIVDVQQVHASDGLILHGGYIGATFCW
jgi:hypothetical protein